MCNPGRLSISALKVGQSTQVMEVSGANPVLQTETADVGDVVQQQQINDLPLEWPPLL